MEIHLKENEQLHIFAKAPDGTEKTFIVSYLEMMHRGETLTDGLTEREIGALKQRKKISAIKSVRARTRMGLKEAKETVEAWVERNQCCRSWPYCEHTETIRQLDPEKFAYRPKGLMIDWAYIGEVTIEQAKALMREAGYNAIQYGFYSYRIENGETMWASNNSKLGEM